MNPTPLFTLPPELEALTADTHWHETSGESGSRVFRLTHLTQPVRFLKISPRDIQRDLWLERDKLIWLRPHLPVPQVLAFAEDEANQYLLTRAVPGVDATAPILLENPSATVRMLARGLRQIHEVDAQECPFDRRTPQLLAEARQRVDHDLVDVSDFDDARAGQSAHQAFAALLQQHASFQDDLCLLHGDYCFPNIIVNLEHGLDRHGLDHMTIAGYIDLGGAGIGDRYFDLALAERSIRRNVGLQWVDVFFEAYGLPPAHVDWPRIHFFQHVDEFF